MLKINQGFICQICGKENEPASATCRNHCRYCLFSQHLDLAVPGDRLAGCEGMMQPIAVDQDGKKGFVITHLCLKCGHRQNNKTAPDDDFDQIIQLSQRQIATPKKIPHFVHRDRKKKMRFQSK